MKKRTILKKAIQKGKGGANESVAPTAQYDPRKYSRSIYRSGPWSDSLGTTTVKQQVTEFNKKNK